MGLEGGGMRRRRSSENRELQVPENQTVPWEWGARKMGVWTGRSDVASVGIEGGCESAGVWVSGLEDMELLRIINGCTSIKSNQT